MHLLKNCDRIDMHFAWEVDKTPVFLINQEWSSLNETPRGKNQKFEEDITWQSYQ